MRWAPQSPQAHRLQLGAQRMESQHLVEPRGLPDSRKTWKLRKTGTVKPLWTGSWERREFPGESPGIPQRVSLKNSGEYWYLHTCKKLGKVEPRSREYSSSHSQITENSAFPHQSHWKTSWFMGHCTWHVKGLASAMENK